MERYFDFLKEKIILFISVFSILIILILTVFYFENIFLNVDSGMEFQDKSILFSAHKAKYTIVFLLLILFVLLSNKLYEEFETFIKYQKERVYTSYVNRQTEEDYRKITEETTQREKQKLYKSWEFANMFEKKGDDEANWNWQMRDRIRGRRNVISDDELSNVSVSADE